MKTKFKKGFSLVELLVVITIIAILSVVAYTAIGGQTTKARDSKRMQDLDTIQSALEVYIINEETTYPTTVQGLSVIPKKYLSKLLTDPGKDGENYVYASDGSVYEIAATLENDGALADFRAYVVGNAELSDNMIGCTGGSESYDVSICGNCTSDDQVVDGGTCLPYHPSDLP